MTTYSIPLVKSPYSAIVYKDGGSILAKDVDGKIITSGTAGTDDQAVIEAAFNALPSTGGNLLIKNGDYNINSLTDRALIGYSNYRVGLLLSQTSNYATYGIIGESPGFWGVWPGCRMLNGVRFIVTADAINAVESGKIAVPIFAEPSSIYRVFQLENISVLVPNNDVRRIIGIEFNNVDMKLKNVNVQVDIDQDVMTTPITNSYGVFGPASSRTNMNIIEDCNVTGFWAGWYLPGEHIYARNTVAMVCVYPFYLAAQAYVYHSNIFIDCGEEWCINGVYIGSSAQAGSNFDFIGYDIEYSLQGNFIRLNEAQEANPGRSSGHVSHARIRRSVGIVHAPFFNAGSGQRFTSPQSVSNGTSTGTGSEQTIAHGLGVIPDRISVNATSDPSGTTISFGTAPDATNFYVIVTNSKAFAWKAKINRA